MRGSLPTTNRSLARPLRSIAIIVTAAGAILGLGFVRSDTATPVDQTDVAPPGAPAPCDAEAPHSPSAEVRTGRPWRFVPCTGREAGPVCACAICAADAWCAPIKTRGTRPRSPGGGPDD